MLENAGILTRKEKYGHLIEGRGGRDVSGEREGWKLTLNGVKWLKNNERRISEFLEQERPKEPKIEVARFLNKIRREEVFKEFINSRNIDKMSEYGFLDILNCPPDAPAESIKKKFHDLKTKATFVNEKDVNEFINLCEKKFNYLIN